MSDVFTKCWFMGKYSYKSGIRNRSRTNMHGTWKIWQNKSNVVGKQISSILFWVIKLQRYIMNQKWWIHQAVVMGGVGCENFQCMRRYEKKRQFLIQTGIKRKRMARSFTLLLYAPKKYLWSRDITDTRIPQFVLTKKMNF